MMLLSNVVLSSVLICETIGVYVEQESTTRTHLGRADYFKQCLVFAFLMLPEQLIEDVQDGFHSVRSLQRASLLIRT